MRAITPINSLGMQPTLHGRIRLGVKAGKAMKAISTYRFTSPDKAAVEELAALYGGTPARWDDPKQSVKNQWEVISLATEIHIYLPQNAISMWYECWSGGGLLRQCDGVTCFIPGPDGMEEGSCICTMKQKMECKVQTRMHVILPEIRFGGVWRLDTKGINATKELPAMEAAIRNLQQQGLLDAQLRLEQREKISNGIKNKYVVPVLGSTASPLALISGGGTVRGALTEGATAVVETLALPAADEDAEGDAEDVEVEDFASTTDTTMEDIAELVRRYPGLGLDEDDMARAVRVTADSKGISETVLLELLLHGDVQIVTVNAAGILRLRKGKQ